jgi:hypothetical protein
LLSLHLSFLLLNLQLLLSLVKHITHQHLSMERLHSILLFKELLVCLNDSFIP